MIAGILSFILLPFCITFINLNMLNHPCGFFNILFVYYIFYFTKALVGQLLCISTGKMLGRILQPRLVLGNTCYLCLLMIHCNGYTSYPSTLPSAPTPQYLSLLLSSCWCVCVFSSVSRNMWSIYLCLAYSLIWPLLVPPTHFSAKCGIYQASAVVFRGETYGPSITVSNTFLISLHFLFLGKILKGCCVQEFTHVL